MIFAFHGKLLKINTLLIVSIKYVRVTRIAYSNALNLLNISDSYLLEPYFFIVVIYYPLKGFSSL